MKMFMLNLGQVARIFLNFESYKATGSSMPAFFAQAGNHTEWKGIMKKEEYIEKKQKETAELKRVAEENKKHSLMQKSNGEQSKGTDFKWTVFSFA